MANGIPTERFEKVEVTSAGELRPWLETHHHREENVRLVTFKKHVGGQSVSVDQVLDELIAFGWIDGIRRKLDEDRTMQVIGPRQTRAWARCCKDRAARLIDEGRMRTPGLAAIEASKRNGQ